MKKQLLSVLFLSGIIALTSCKKKEEENTEPTNNGTTSYTLTNLGFEDWFTTGSPFQYPNPSPSWGCGNPVNDNLQTTFVFCKDTTFAAEGNKAALLRTLDAGGAKATGNIFLGSFTSKDPIDIMNNPNGWSPLDFGDLGVPYNNRVASLSGKYHYIPVNGDSALIYVGVTKWNSTTNQRDTIGAGALTFYNASPANTFEDFTIPLSYNSNETPDSLMIYALSSAGGVQFLGEVDNTIILDDFKITNE